MYNRFEVTKGLQVFSTSIQLGVENTDHIANVLENKL